MKADPRSALIGWPGDGLSTAPMRGAAVLSAFLALTLPLMPVQALLLRLSTPAARRFPHWYHRQVCRLLGIRLHIRGEVLKDRPVLLIANHTSWLDIPVLSAVAPVSFVAKKEVDSWPFVRWLARLQRSVFVDRTRRVTVGSTASEMSERLKAGDVLVLFAEGTSSDGNRVLPFKTSLFAAAKPGRTQSVATDGDGGVGPVVQTLTFAYTHVHGVPVSRADRSMIGWYGDMAMGGHAWALLKAGPLDVHVVIGPPKPLESFADRKQLASLAEAEIRATLAELLRRPRRR